jgi:hypothetical protein
MQYFQKNKWIIPAVFFLMTIAHAQQPEVFVQLGHAESVTTVAFSSDGKFALSGSSDKILKLWDISSGHEIWRFYGHSDWNNAVAFSPDGKLALLGNRDKTIKLWKVSCGCEIRRLKGHAKSVNGVAFSPDGKLALSGSSDQTLKLWEVSSGREIRTLKGHAKSVNAVAFSPDGKFALSGSDDGSTRLWHVQTGEEIAHLVAFKNGEWATVTAQGFYVASAGGEKYIKVRVGNKVSGVEPYRAQFNRAEWVRTALQFENTPPRILGIKNQIVVENLSTYSLRGQVVDESEVASVTVNGQSVRLDKQGYFSVDVPLRIGENLIHMSAKNIFNNYARHSLTVINNDTNPPQIVLPDEKPRVIENVYTLRGQVIDQSEVGAVSINGQVVRLDKQGHFSYRVSLPIGRKKQIQITATDVENNRTDQKLILEHRCTETEQLSREDIDAMYRYKVKVAFKGERQASQVSRDISPSCLHQAVFLDLSHLDLVYLPDWLSKFSQLRKLDISYNQLSPAALSLGKLSALEVLDVSHNPLFKESCWLKVWCSIKPTMPAIWQHLSGLRVLNLSHTGGDAENYGDLSHLKKLYQLDLNHNRLSSIVNLNLDEINGLLRLDLSHNQLEEIDFAQLSPGLQILDLSHNELGHLTFAPLEDLFQLNLKANRQVTFDIEFEDPFTLPALGNIEFDDAVNMPEGLIKKLDSWLPLVI